MATDRDLEVTHAGEWFTMQGHFIQRECLPAALITAQHTHHQGATLLNRPLLVKHLLKHPIEISQIGLRQEAKVSGVDGEDWHLHRSCLPCRRKHGAIAPQNNRQCHRGIESLRYARVVTKQAQMLIWIGKANHSARTTCSDHFDTSLFKPRLKGQCGLYRQLFAVINDQSDTGHRSNEAKNDLTLWGFNCFWMQQRGDASSSTQSAIDSKLLKEAQITRIKPANVVDAMTHHAEAFHTKACRKPTPALWIKPEAL